MYPAVHAQNNPDKPAVIMGSGEVVSFELREFAVCIQHALPIEGCVMLYSSGTTGYRNGIRNANPDSAII